MFSQFTAMSDENAFRENYLFFRVLIRLSCLGNLFPTKQNTTVWLFHRENSRIQCAFKELWKNKEHMNIRRRKLECDGWEIQKPTRRLQDKEEIQRLPCHTQGLSFCHIIPYFIHKQQAQCCTSCSLHAEYNNVCVCVHWTSHKFFIVSLLLW